jgi:tetratricopeptide (TPR) repeat protein
MLVSLERRRWIAHFAVMIERDGSPGYNRTLLARCSLSTPKEAIVRLATLLAVLLCPVMSAASEQSTKEQIARWVKDLGDDSYATRQEASRRLWEAGQAAEEAVAEAVKSSDPEVARRARALMDKFKWGIYPDTPPKVVELIQRYRGSDANAKQAIVRELFALGNSGCTALLRITKAEPDDGLRPRLFQQIALEAAHAAPALLQEGQYATLERLLEIGLAADQVASYVACILLQGKLDEKIAVYKVRAEREDGKRAAEVLAYMYRAKGDLAAARQAAAKAGRKELEEAILFEAGDWKELAALDLPAANRRPVELLGFKAAYQRLSGNSKEFEETVKEIRTYRAKPNTNPIDAWLAAKALFLNDRPNDAAALLDDSRRAEAFDVLCAQMRFTEALALVEKAKTDRTDYLWMLDVLQARTLYQLGEKEKAAKLFADLAGRIIKEGLSLAWPEKLIEVEYRLGLKELAFEHCTHLLTVTKANGRTTTILDKVFPGKGETAAPLWKFLYKRLSPNDPAVAVMKRLREVMSCQDKRLGFIDLSKPLTVRYEIPPEDARQWDLAILDVALSSHPDEEARSRLDHVLSLSGSAAGAIRYGDYWLEQKNWDRAAEYYDAAWKLDPREPLPLYLRGYALVQAGKEKEGKRLMELAHWLPLGNESLRALFMMDLARRHHRDAVLREAELLLRVSVPGSFYAGEGFRQLAIDALRRGDHQKAADYHERAMLRCLRAQVGFFDTTAYLALPHFVHRHRARALIEANRIDEALKEADLCLAALPGNSDLQALLVPELAKRGRTADADALFARCYDPYAKLCQEYPQSAWAHNGFAWLCASTRRRLDAALDHAQKAVDLEPTHPGYRDTLAEIHFQRGDKDKAIAEIKRSIGLDDKRAYFKKQLKRFEAGDPLTELPSALDED